MSEKTVVAIQWGIVIGASLVAAIRDLKTRRIPNLLSGPLFIAGLVWSAWQRGGHGFAEAVAAAVVLALPFVVLFIFASGGAGDAKLTGAIGTWLSIKEAGIALICICIAGGILGLAIAVYKRRLKSVFINMFAPVFELLVSFMCRVGVLNALKKARSIEGEKLTVPYGVAIFVGVCIAGGIVLL